jgi:hypothetical protein
MQFLLFYGQNHEEHKNTVFVLYFHSDKGPGIYITVIRESSFQNNNFFQSTSDITPLWPSGYVTYNKFNSQGVYILPRVHLYILSGSQQTVIISPHNMY